MKIKAKGIEVGEREFEWFLKLYRYKNKLVHEYSKNNDVHYYSNKLNSKPLSTQFMNGVVCWYYNDDGYDFDFEYFIREDIYNKYKDFLNEESIKMLKEKKAKDYNYLSFDFTLNVLEKLCKDFENEILKLNNNVIDAKFLEYENCIEVLKKYAEKYEELKENYEDLINED